MSCRRVRGSSNKSNKRITLIREWKEEELEMGFAGSRVYVQLVHRSVMRGNTNERWDSVRMDIKPRKRARE